MDSSRAMLGVLRRAAKQQGIANVRCIGRRWEDVDVAGEAAPADAVVCSYVLPLIAEAEPFLAKMDAACSGRAFAYMNAMSADALVDPFWRHFHGRPRKAAPTYLDAVAMLRDLGIEPEVEVVEVRSSYRFADLPAAVRSYQEMLVLQGTAAVRAELRSLLRRDWLRTRGSSARRSGPRRQPSSRGQVEAVRAPETGPFGRPATTSAEPASALNVARQRLEGSSAPEAGAASPQPPPGVSTRTTSPA